MPKPMLASVQQAFKLAKAGQFSQALTLLKDRVQGEPNPKKPKLKLLARLKAKFTPAKPLPELPPAPIPQPELPPKPKQKAPPKPKPAPRTPPREAQFLTKLYSNQQGRREFKLYIPRGYEHQPVPLIIMLHGCNQTSEDFALGTQMNQLADELGFLVAYPNQPSKANFTRCWNWFKAQNQHRDKGEPALIAGITQTILDTYTVDKKRVYIAGLSAGGAMASTMAALYPDVYAGVGVHSGLAFGCANDMMSALSAMKLGRKPVKALSSQPLVPTIIFHGDQDTTVNPANGTQVFNQAKTRLKSDIEYAESVSVQRPKEGYAHTVTRIKDPKGQVQIEHWLIHGAGHAWMGGNPEGSYTDAQHPNAAREMVKFFLAKKAVNA